MQSMTRWEQSPVFDAGNPNQRTITAFAFGPPGNGGFQNVWFNPIAPGVSAQFVDGPPGGGISGALAGPGPGVFVAAGLAVGAILGGLLGWRLGG